MNEALQAPGLLQAPRKRDDIRRAFRVDFAELTARVLYAGLGRRVDHKTHLGGQFFVYFFGYSQIRERDIAADDFDPVSDGRDERGLLPPEGAEAADRLLFIFCPHEGIDRTAAGSYKFFYDFCSQKPGGSGEKNGCTHDALQ